MSHPSRVQYKLSWDDADAHLYDLEVTFRPSQRETLLRLPAWRPGRYLIQNYAANVRQWWAKNVHGKTLPVEKVDKSTWLIRSRPNEKVTFGYRFFAGVLDAGSSYLSRQEAYFNGTNLFVMVDEQRDVPVSLDLKVPEGWRVETQLTRDDRGIFHARDYDYLIDSPAIVSPSLITHTFEESGCRVSLVFQNAAEDDTARFVDPVRAIVRAHIERFEGIPTRSYRFLYHYADLWHGVEHEDSCSITVKSDEVRGSKPGSAAFDHFLAITSHEFFHLWNVKRILPQSFLPYDYSRETYTRLLWAMEGITSYFGERTILTSGLWTTERYLEHLATEIGTLEAIPGKNFLSLSQASFDGWLQEPAQMHDKSNAWISFYNKGEIVAALLDLEIRRRTAGKRSLDDLMRTLWTRYGKKKKGIEEDAIARIARSVTGSDFSDFFRRYVDGVEPLPYDEVFGAAGLRLRQVDDAARPALNAAVSVRGGRLRVEDTVDPELERDDEILAIDGRRVATKAELDKHLETAGATVAITISRNGALEERKTSTIRTTKKKWTIEPIEKISEPQRLLRESWLEVKP